VIRIAALALTLSALVPNLAWHPVTEHLRIYTVYDGTLSESERADVRAAEKDWEDHVPTLHFEQVSDCEHALICVESTYGLPDGTEGVTRVSVGEPGGMIALDAMAQLPGEFQAIAAHELGHAMGLPHGEPGEVMCWSIQCAAWRVTDGDVDAWYAARGWARP
jgi:hypothetical protein